MMFERNVERVRRTASDEGDYILFKGKTSDKIQREYTTSEVF